MRGVMARYVPYKWEWVMRTQEVKPEGPIRQSAESAASVWMITK